jgi:dTDP-4-dehydrorhamnose reductase
MLGRDLMRAFGERGISATGMDVEECNVVDPASCMTAVRGVRPAVVINCAAYTDVNRAEAERELAFAVNGAGAHNVARACAETGSLCVYISTDYVFDGSKPHPYIEADPPGPLNAYGASKLEGEQRTAEAAPEHAIVRTSWLYGANGRNFVTTILARAKQGGTISVVADQFGSPTYTRDLAGALVEIALRRLTGILHVTNSGWCSWHGLASRIVELAGISGIRVDPQPAAEYKTPAQRPANSRLAAPRTADLGLPSLPPWEDALGRFLREIQELD